MATSPAAVKRHLRGASYPADLDDLIAQAEENDAPSDVVETIETLEERTYDSPPTSPVHSAAQTTMTDGRQGAGRRPDAGDDFSGSPQEGEQLPEEQQAGHPFTSSTPQERSRKAGLPTSEDGDVPDPPATGNPRNAPE